jgi:hypothetical protein
MKAGIVGLPMLENQHYSIVHQMQKRKVLTFLFCTPEPIGVVNVPDLRIENRRISCRNVFNSYSRYR